MKNRLRKSRFIVGIFILLLTVTALKSSLVYAVEIYDLDEDVEIYDIDDSVDIYDIDEGDYYEEEDNYYEPSYYEDSSSGGYIAPVVQATATPTVTPLPYLGYCPYAKILSPVYEGMNTICGIAGPGCKISIVVNCGGKTGKWNNIQIDDAGFFSITQIPVEFKEGDFFDVYVQDSVGDSTTVHQDIKSSKDTAVITSEINPVGKSFYSGKKKSNNAYWAVPVALKDFAEKDIIEIPLLWGMRYKAGTLILKKTEAGIRVSSELHLNEKIAPENYSAGEGELYVYSSIPSLKSLKNADGEKVENEGELSLEEDACIWIQYLNTVSLREEDIAELETYDVENSEVYQYYRNYE